MQALQLYMNITRIIPSEKEWNRFAMEEKLLSSQSIQYLSQKELFLLYSYIIVVLAYFGCIFLTLPSHPI